METVVSFLPPLTAASVLKHYTLSCIVSEYGDRFI